MTKTRHFHWYIDILSNFKLKTHGVSFAGWIDIKKDYKNPCSISAIWWYKYADSNFTKHSWKFRYNTWYQVTNSCGCICNGISSIQTQLNTFKQYEHILHTIISNRLYMHLFIYILTVYDNPYDAYWHRFVSITKLKLNKYWNVPKM